MALTIDTGDQNVVEIVMLYMEDGDDPETLSATLIPYPEAVPPPRRLTAITLRKLADALDELADTAGD